MTTYRAVRIANGLARVLRIDYREGGRVDLWNRRMLRRDARCAVTGLVLSKGSQAYGPIGNQRYRAERISADLIDAKPLLEDIPMPETEKPRTEQSPAEGRHAPRGSAPDAPVANDAECAECGEVFGSAEGGDICPNDPTHLAEPLFVTDSPLGYSDDQDFYHFGREQYEYPARFSG